MEILFEPIKRQSELQPMEFFYLFITFFFFIYIFHIKKVLTFHANPLPSCESCLADDSHEMSRLFSLKNVLDCYLFQILLAILYVNPYLAVHDNSSAGGVCQLKSLSYLQYTTCNHSEQVFSYRSEPTFIQTRHFSLDSQVLDFTHTKKDREYQISSCH